MVQRRTSKLCAGWAPVPSIEGALLKTMNNRETGSRYEEKAAAYLKQQGYEILEKNFRCRTGAVSYTHLFSQYWKCKEAADTGKGMVSDPSSFKAGFYPFTIVGLIHSQ